MEIKTDEIVEIEKIKCSEEFFDLHTKTENYIANGIVTHNCSPHKKSRSVGFYMPDSLKEKIDIVVCCDVSGSIGQTELRDFLSEVIGIAQAFREKINMRILTHEIEINDDYLINNGNVEKIKQLKINGGGGTSHIQPFNFIKENIKDCKCCIFLTDGFSDIDDINFEEYSFHKLFVISEGGNDRQLINKNCHTIKLNKELK